jgi:hypothetical protein
MCATAGYSIQSVFCSNTMCTKHKNTNMMSDVDNCEAPGSRCVMVLDVREHSVGIMVYWFGEPQCLFPVCLHNVVFSMNMPTTIDAYPQALAMASLSSVRLG